MTQATEIKASSTVLFATGCYSDYSVGCLGRVLKPINKAVWDEMVKGATVAPSYAPEPRFESAAAMAWLIANGYIEEVTYVGLHLGDYGDTPKWENA